MFFGKDKSQPRLSDYGRVWLVGASSGIGLALAKALDEGDRRLFVSARTESPLNQLRLRQRAQVIPLAMDMTNEFDVGACVHQIEQSAGGLDMLVVNAGTCEYIDGLDLDMEMTRRVMETNFFGAISLINRALPLLKKAASATVRPKIVVMSSSVTYQALPRAHAYGASKAALRYFVDCLKIDLDLAGIDVHVVSPGFVKTPLTDLNDFPMPFCLDAEQAAERIIKGLERHRYDIHFPYRFTLILKAFSHLPARIRFALLGKMARPQSLSLPESISTHNTGDSYE